MWDESTCPGDSPLALVIPPPDLLLLTCDTTPTILNTTPKFS